MHPARWLYTVPLRIRSLFRRARVEQELHRELQFHLEQRTEELVARGTPPSEAHLIALREMGGIEQRKEECRDARRVRALEDLVRDLIFGLRILRKSPGFTIVVISALALGIGANTALFSLFHQVLVRNLPVRNPEQLVAFSVMHPRFGELSSFSYSMFRQLGAQNTVLSGLIGLSGLDLNVGSATGSDKARGELVSGNYFEVLGVPPAHGRVFNRMDDQTPGAHPVAVLSHAYWQRRFGGDPNVIGSQLILNGQPVTVIGVSAAGFYGIELGTNPDIRLPLVMSDIFRAGPHRNLDNPGHWWLRLLGRLQPGVSRAQAEAALAVLHRQIRAEEVAQTGTEMSERAKKDMLDLRPVLAPGGQGLARLQGSFAKPLRLLFAITVVILVITCANLANMLLARNAAREKEIAMRLALGASRWRIVRQWLTESALLSLAGGAAGILLSTWCQGALLSFIPASERMNLSATPDLPVLGFALAVSILTGLAFGVIPALQVSRTSIEQTQKKGNGRVSGGFRGGLVVLQIALCLPLLVVAGLFLHSLRNTRTIPTGFDGRHVILASINPLLNGYPEASVRQFFDRLLLETRAIPGVEAAGLATSVVLSGEADKIAVVVEGYEAREGEDRSPFLNTVSPGYFDAIRLPVVAGRAFTERDHAAAPRVGLINETMARYYFGTANPIGKKFGTDKMPDIEIVGVVKDAKYVSVREEPERHYYLPMAQNGVSLAMTLHVRTTSDPQMFVELLRSRVRAIDANVPLYNIKTLAAEIDDSLAQDRLVAWLSTALGLLATLLATIGLYGVIAFSVARRTREVGIRMALGAQRAHILALIMKRVGALLAAGSRGWSSPRSGWRQIRSRHSLWRAGRRSDRVRQRDAAPSARCGHCRVLAGATRPACRTERGSALRIAGALTFLLQKSHGALTHRFGIRSRLES